MVQKRGKTERERETDEKIDHFIHRHELVLRSPRTESNPMIGCDICNGLIKDKYYYGCSELYDRGAFWLHMSCAEYQRDIEHPFHPQHPLSPCLTAQDVDVDVDAAVDVEGYVICDACSRSDCFPQYYCSLRDFNLHVECSKLVPEDAGQPVELPGHPHPLFSLSP